MRSAGTSNIGPSHCLTHLTKVRSFKASLQFDTADQIRAKTRLLNVDVIPTTPKPDIWFAFPIDWHEEEERNRFPFERLLDLERQAHLCSNPLRPLEKYRTNLTDAKLICYPWFLIEIKKKDFKAEFCYCQAANGCSALLSMLESLTRHLEDQQTPMDIEPIVSLTVVGFEVKIWLAYTTKICLRNSNDGSWSSEHVRDPFLLPGGADISDSTCNAFGRAQRAICVTTSNSIASSTVCLTGLYGSSVHG